MPLLDIRLFTELFNRLLRPEQATRNAHGAATEASRTVREREVIDRDVDAIRVDRTTD